MVELSRIILEKYQEIDIIGHITFIDIYIFITLFFKCLNICRGALTQPPGSTMDDAVAMVARSLWSVQVLKILRSLFPAPDVRGL